MGLFKHKTRESENGDKKALMLVRSKRRLVPGTGELGNSAFWSCVILLAKLYATLPLNVYSKDRNGNRKEASLVVQNLLKKPNRWMTHYEAIFIMALNAEMTGAGYAIKVFAPSGVISYLIPVPTGAVVETVDENGNTFYHIDGKTYTSDEMLVIKLTPSGFSTVLSPAYYAKDDLDLEAKCKEMQLEYFDGASVIGNLIKVPSSLTPQQKDELKAGFDTTNGFRNIVIDNRVEVTPIQVNSADVSKLVEAQKWTARQVAARFGVPGWFVGLTEGAYNNLEDQQLNFLIFCLNPRLRAWEEALTDSLCTGSDYIEFNREGLLQANSAAKLAYYNGALNNGWMNRNEIRAKENLPSLGKDGDVFFMQTAMAPVDRIISGDADGSGKYNPWNAPQEKISAKPVAEDKKKQERLFVEEATKQAKTARKSLEQELSRQLKDDLAAFKGYMDAGIGFEKALQQFSQELKTIGDKHRDAYVKIYRTVADKLKPVVTKQCKSDQEVQDQPLDEFIGQYVDSLMGRHEGFIYKHMEKTGYDPDDFESESENLKANYPYNESNEEVNRSSNALSLFMFAALGVTVYHIVTNSDCCAFCEQMDGKIASINGYVLNKGDNAPDGDGGVRKIDKNYRHPPFHTRCGCHVAPGE